ncbi:MAG: phenylacetate--CoA ligase [Clostridiales bacterium]|nr:phenylacetate--CoA ligase [Clostridiales bacterium]
MIFSPAIECAERSEIEAIQLDRLKSTVKRVYETVPYYKEKLDAAGVKPEDIQSLDDLKKIPFTTKADMRANYPYRLFAVPMKDIVRIHASSGTTGTATVVGYTKTDLDNWAECVARVVCQAGATPDDIAQISFGYGLFTGALGLHYGLEKLGAAVIPVSAGNTKRQIQLMQDYGTTLLVGTPSYALYIGETAKQMGVDLHELPIRLGVLGAEGHTEEMRKAIEDLYGMRVFENYGLSEVMGPGVAGECTEQVGMHIAEDHFIVEIIDPETGENKAPGEMGEVVITTITKEGQPLLRYRTRDISSISYEKCACGRTSARMHKVLGRSDDMLIIRGVNVFPSQIESVILSVPGAGPNYEIIVTKENHMDRLEVLVEVNSAELLAKFAELERITNSIRSRLREEILLDVKVSLVNPMSLKRFEGKAKRVTDLRDKGE